MPKSVCRGRSAIPLITSDNQWKLVNEEPGDELREVRRQGAEGWGQGIAQDDAVGISIQPAATRLRSSFSNPSFPPMIVMEPRMSQNQFQVGAAWAKALRVSTTALRAAVGLRALVSGGKPGSDVMDSPILRGAQRG